MLVRRLCQSGECTPGAGAAASALDTDPGDDADTFFVRVYVDGGTLAEFLFRFVTCVGCGVQ